jgi:rhodanese-related sulfurtransferase
MLDTLKQLFGFGPKVDYAQLVKEGAIILDVRSKGEYQGGHIKGSINISLDTLSNNLSKLKKDKPIITCCASGMRSASAKSILKSNGFKEVYNGGGWSSLQNKLNNH